MKTLIEQLQLFKRALGYSLQGLKSAWQKERAFRQEVSVFCILMVVAILLPVSGWEKIALIGVLIFVLIVELLNSAIERAVDHTSLAQSELAGRAKDMAAAAVLLSLVFAAIVWLFVMISWIIS